MSWKIIRELNGKPDCYRLSRSRWYDDGLVVGARFGSGLVSTVDRMDGFAFLTTGFLAERKVRTHKHPHTFHSKMSSSIELHLISSCKKLWDE